MAKQVLKLGWQKDILATMLKDTDVIKRCRSVVRPKFFSSVPFRWLCNRIYKHYETYGGEILERKAFLIDLKKHIGKADERSAYKKVVLPLYKRNIKARKRVVDAIYEWAEIQSFALLLHRAAKQGEHGNLIKAKDIIRSSFLFDASNNGHMVCDFTDEWEQRQEERKLKSEDKDRKQVRFGLEPLDNVCQIYTDSPLLIVLAATSGVGKSIFSIHLGANAFLEGIKVAHFVFENVISQAMGRYDSRLLGFNYRNLMRHDWKRKELRSAKKYMKKLRNKFKNNLKVMHFPLNTCSVSMADSTLRELEITEGWKPDVIIYDSLDHMIPTDKTEMHRINVGRVYAEAKKQGEDRNIPIISTSHLKASERGQLSRMEGFSESYEKARLCDVWVTINQTVEQEDDRQALVFLDKNRDDEGNVKILVDLMYSIMNVRFNEVIG